MKKLKKKIQNKIEFVAIGKALCQHHTINITKVSWWKGPDLGLQPVRDIHAIKHNEMLQLWVQIPVLELGQRIVFHIANI